MNFSPKYIPFPHNSSLISRQECKVFQYCMNINRAGAALIKMIENMSMIIGRNKR